MRNSSDVNWNTEHPQYYGIMGATDGNGFINPAGRKALCCSCCDSQTISVGLITAGGVFGPLTGYSFKDFLDGTTNQIMVGESSAPVYISIGGPKTSDVQGIHGIMMGSPEPTPRSKPRPGCTFERQFNLTTVRYPPNSPATYDPNNPSPALWPGVGDNFGINKPLNSNHTGSINALMGDGSVRSISDNINMLTLRQICTRDDGAAVGDY